MINLSDQLKQLPNEFIMEMERQKDERWKDVYQFILDRFDCRDEIIAAETENFDLHNFFKTIHDMGFYGGVNFALDHQEEYSLQN
jgi:hypothetical protein